MIEGGNVDKLMFSFLSTCVDRKKVEEKEYLKKKKKKMNKKKGGDI
jgi:hypothetical protein